MPYQIEWDEPGSILTLRLIDRVTLDEFDRIDQEIAAHFAEAPESDSFMLIVDTDSASSVPQDFTRLQMSQRYAAGSTPKLRHILVVSGKNRLMRLMMLLIYNLCSPNLRFFDTLDQAHGFVRQVRHSTLRAHPGTS
jgi:hypothetical protein